MRIELIELTLWSWNGASGNQFQYEINQVVDRNKTEGYELVDLEVVPPTQSVAPSRNQTTDVHGNIAYYDSIDTHEVSGKIILKFKKTALYEALNG